MKTKLELGCGSSPIEGYLHQDVTRQPNIELDYICDPHEIPINENSLDEVIAIGVMEHLRFEEVEKTLNHMCRILKPNGYFLFDVPDMRVWSEYLYNVTHNKAHLNEFSSDHIWKTIYGHQRWLGDEHKSGWTHDDILYIGKRTGFSNIIIDKKVYIDAGIFRNRMKNDKNAHLYIKMTK